jgi:hypothetical protein
MTEFGFGVFFYGCIALILLWHLVVHPIILFWEQHLIDRENEAELKLSKDYSDALHQKNGQEVRELLTPEQWREIEHHYM